MLEGIGERNWEDFNISFLHFMESGIMLLERGLGLVVNEYCKFNNNSLKLKKYIYPHLKTFSHCF